MMHYAVKLAKQQVKELNAMINKGSHAAESCMWAFVLLNCDEGAYLEEATNEQISKVYSDGMRTIETTKKKFL